MKTKKQKTYFSNRIIFILIVGIFLFIVSLSVNAGTYRNSVTKVGHNFSELNLSYNCPTSGNGYSLKVNGSGSFKCENDDLQYSSSWNRVIFTNSLLGGNLEYFIVNGVFARASCESGGTIYSAEAQISGSRTQVRVTSPCITSFISYPGSASCGGVTASQDHIGVILNAPGCQANLRGYW